MRAGARGGTLSTMQRLLALGWGCTLAMLAAAPTAAQDGAWYDPAPLLESLRPAQREGLAARLDVARLDDLPFYDVDLTVSDGLEGYAVRETIYVTHDGTAPWPEVVLRIFGNAAVAAGQSPPVTLLGGRCLDGIACVVEASAPSVVRVRLSSPLQPGARVRIELELRGVLRAIEPSRTSLLAQGLEGLTSLHGGGGGDYGLLSHSDGVASIAQGFAVLAPRHDAGFVTDDGGPLGDLGTDAMSNVRARVVVPRGAHVAGTGIETDATDLPPGEGHGPRTAVTLHAGLVRDFAVLVGAPLEHRERSVRGVTVRSWHRAGSRAAGGRVLSAAAGALSLFERRFGAYPYTELDLVEAPLVGGAGGVEFSGLVTIATMFYADPGAHGGGLGGALGGAGALAEMQASMLEFVTAHEVAHQWWHGIVGSDSRAHPWVDESLAQWSALLWVEDTYGRARAEQEGDRQVAMNYRAMRMSGAADAAVDQPTSAFAGPLSYAGLVYGKGPYFYRALRAELGDAALFSGLRAYVERHRYRLATGRGPVDALATGRHAEAVRTLARRWLDEAHGDEDLGASTDPADAVATMIPPELRETLARDPAMRAMLGRLVQGMLRGDGGGLEGLGGLSGLLGGAGGGDAAGGDAAEAAGTLRELEGILGQLPDSSSP